MTQSPEYPDLRWMPPKSWTDANRTSVQLIVIHTTEGSEGPTSAEDGAAYDQRRADGTSTHFFHDGDSTVQCVRTADQAHAARTQGNKRGIQHELCGRAGQGDAGWADAVSQGTLRQAARQCARDAKRWGIPVRHLTVAQVANGDKGFCGHVDITRAFPQDSGTHTDPGPDFPWSQFLDLVRAEMEDDMTPDEMLALLRSDDGKRAIGQAVMQYDPGYVDGDPAKGVWPGIPDTTYSDPKGNGTVGLGTALGTLLSRQQSNAAADAAAAQGVLTALVTIAGKDQVDETALAAALAPAVAAAVVASLPAGSDPVSQAEVTKAVKAAFADAFGSHE